MEKSAEKWGSEGPGGNAPVGVRGRIPLKLSNKNKTQKLHKTALHLPVLPVFNLV